MNVLYLGDINSIHDFKWVTYFSGRNEFNVYFLTEFLHYNELSDEWRVKLEQEGVTILDPIDSFSLKNLRSSFSSIKTIKRYLKTYQIDIFHPLFGSPQPIWLNFLSNVKSIVTTRGSDILVLLKSLKSSKSIKDRILFFLLLRGLKKASFIASTSQKQIDYLKTLGIPAEKLNLIKTGVEVQAIKNHPLHHKVATKKEKFIFSARYIGPIYNMEYQIEAIKALPKCIREEYSFLFIKGTNCELSFFESFKAKLDAIDGLQFDVVDGITQLEIWSTLKASAVTYMVPLSDGTPNTALECMAGRVPFIMGDLDYNRELFENVSYRADLSDAKDLANKIQLSIRDYPVRFLDKGEQNVHLYGSRTFEMNKLKELYFRLNA